MTVIEIVTMESAEGKQIEFTLVHHELFIINVSLYTTTTTTTTTATFVNFNYVLWFITHM